MSPPRILVIPGSTRTSSHNVRLGKAITKALKGKNAEATLVSLADYPMPLYDGDLEAKDGVPHHAQKLGALIAEHHGVVLVNPEYNASMTPLMKNTLDWLSRDLGDIKPYANRVYALASCSPGALGGIRCLPHVRDVLVSIGAAHILTRQLAVGQAFSAFNDDDQLTNERQQAMLDGLCDALIEQASLVAQGA